MSIKRKIYCLITILILVALDQLSKGFLITYLKTQPLYIIEVMPFLDFVYAWNYGISFGLFRQYYQYSNIVFLLLNSMIVIYLSNLLTKSDSCIAQAGLTLIIGGAIGNIIDRLFHGAVFDFIYFHYQDYAFPAFNLADSFITVGAALFLYKYYFNANLRP